jgi:hypothetical protein
MQASTGWRIGGALVVVLMLAPVVFDRDSFPLSTYPMYSSARPAVVAIPTAVGIDSSGAEHRLSLRLIGASDDPLIVAGELRTAMADDRADSRCREIAERVAHSRRAEDRSDAPARPSDLVAVEVVMERHDVVAHVTGRPSLRSREVHATCPTGGSP